MKRLLVILALFSQVLFAQNSKILDVNTLASQSAIVAGEPFSIAVELAIKPSMHINSNEPLSEFFIPTVVKIDPVSNISFSAPVFPQADLKTFSFSEDKVSIFDGKVYVVISVSTSPDLALEPVTIKGIVSYQGCDDMVCYAPEEQPFEIILDVVTAGTTVEKLHDNIFANASTESTVEKADDMELTDQEQAALGYLEKGMFSAIIAFFLVGLALNLTPCVYPVIPITVSYFGGQSSTSKGAAFSNAFMYQIGIAIAFALLGLVSGLAGKQWGFLFTSPWFVVIIGTIILLMAASLFGAFEITVPSWLLTKTSKNRQGVVGSLIMGLTVGVVIAPCAAGIIIGLVGLIAKLGLVVKGTILFFVMGLGLGVPYLVLATFSGLLNKLPQSGLWMLWVRKLFAFMLIGVAIYFIVPQLDRLHYKFGFLVGITALTGGLLLGFLEHGMYSKGFKIFRSIVGVALIIMGFMWVNNAINAKESTIDWQHYEDQSMEMLLEEEKPVFIDFYADWCAPCKQLDRETFTDEKVTETSDDFLMLKVDCTKPNAATEALMQKFNVTGMPTLIFLDKNGKELTELREIGFVQPDDFLQSMEKTLK